MSRIIYRYNNLNIRIVCTDEMSRVFRIFSTMNGREYLWFIDRSREAVAYALDELFTEQEAIRLHRHLGMLHEAVHVEKLSRLPASKQQASWNLVGILFEPQLPEDERLPFRVFGCLRSEPAAS